ncbi:MAG: HEAT repeat domain-containing protein [Acidimicrobiia bacterium]|nr:HEAT repeat domain-containing protein [Acidimicrobiia bacterium]
MTQSPEHSEASPTPASPVGDDVARTRSELIFAEVEGDVSALTLALTDDDASVRSLALGALGRIDELDEHQLTTALSDDHRDVRCRAVELAVTRRDIPLVPLLADDDDLVVETAAWGLGEREDPDPDVIEALVAIGISHDVSICREAAIAALGAIGDEAGLPAILHGLDDRAPVRRRAVLALAPFDTPEVSEALERATQDRDRQVRQAAEDLL